LKRSRSESSPGARRIAATITATMPARISSARLSRGAVNSSGIGSASIGAGGSRYSTLKLGRSLISTTS
jgi:hypothetical protein